MLALKKNLPGAVDTVTECDGSPASADRLSQSAVFT